VPWPACSSRRGRDAIRSLGDVRHIISSANGTWLDRLEAVAIGRHGAKVVLTLSGHLAETYSVMPLAAIAAVLLTGRVPSSLGAAFQGAREIPSTRKIAEPFAVLCSDYTGILSAAAIEGVGRI
jgi:hypothetical protein